MHVEVKIVQGINVCFDPQQIGADIFHDDYVIMKDVCTNVCFDPQQIGADIFHDDVIVVT